MADSPKKKINEKDEGIFNDMPPAAEDRERIMEREEHRAEADLEDKQPAGDTGPEDNIERNGEKPTGDTNY